MSKYIGDTLYMSFYPRMTYMISHFPYNITYYYRSIDTINQIIALHQNYLFLLLISSVSEKYLFEFLNNTMKIIIKPVANTTVNIIIEKRKKHIIKGY